ncbi:phosphate/phosphite/phosphonate ABC transporter substrate-binding protein [Novosphingobium sp.]|uniref:phosphate/phosphite/phosphonate ABC transporter substrate-binding protein n=1 Tax=Novosphingobium sp. TaxID=1874826 RepID=UPI003D0979FE
MIASLGMYDPRWLRGANDLLWQAIAGRLPANIAAPAALTRDRPLDAIWTAPDLLLAQTCGYPLMTRLDAAVVATPVYDAPGSEDGWHRSALIVRADDRAQSLADLSGRRIAMNARDSNTGMNLPRGLIAPFAQDGRFFGEVIDTGAHARSLCAVIARHADCAAIDAVTLALWRDRYRGIDRRIRVLAWTEPTPGLPLITAANQSAEVIAALREALADVMIDPALHKARAALRLTGTVVIDRTAYGAVTAIEQRAIAAGYPQLA